MDPISIAATALASLGKIAGGVMDWFGGNAKQKAEDAAGQQALGEAGVASDIAIQQGDAAMAQGAAAASGSGGGVTGSALDAIKGIGVSAMFNARSMAYRGETENQARVYSGKVDAAQGLTGLISGIGSAGGTAIAGFAKGIDQSRLAAGGSGSLSSGGFSGDDAGAGGDIS